MPEGDTLHRTAARLRPVLAGALVTRFSAPRLRGYRPRGGVRVDDVEARGKNLLVHFDDGLTLRTHLRMTGSWHIYRSGERWRQSPGKARVVIEVDTGWVAVCFAAPVVETYHRGGPEPAPLARLGPDLCRDDADLDAVVDRWTALAAPEDEVGVLLLDQRIAAGIGNVYRCEVLFANGIDPFTPAAALETAAVRRLYATAHRLLRANLTTDRRRTSTPSPPPHQLPTPTTNTATTTPPAAPRPPSPPPCAPGAASAPPGAPSSASVPAGASGAVPGSVGAVAGGEVRAIGGGSRGRYAVYGRPGRPCPRCGTPVRTRRQGEQARSVYWCPTCQVRP